MCFSCRKRLGHFYFGNGRKLSAYPSFPIKTNEKSLVPVSSGPSLMHGNNGTRTHDLSRVRRTLIPAELCFHIQNIYFPTENLLDTTYLSAIDKEWTWRESNPRPKTYPMYFYYHSPFFFIPSAARKRTPLRFQ